MEDTGYAATGLKQINGKYYYFKSDGAAVKEAWKTVDKNTYYFDRTGTAYTGPHTISGKIYIFRTDGNLQMRQGLSL